jgi:beta-glucuronidase
LQIFKHPSLQLALIACIALFSFCAAAQGPAPVSTREGTPPLRTLLVGVDKRAVVSLDGPWHYLVDQPPFKALYNERDGSVRDNGYALNTHPNISTDKPHNDEYDFATAPTLKVPGDWNTQEPTLFRYEGVVFYQRDFNFEPRPGTRTFLHVGAANYRSFVWVNGKHICDHEGGFTPFDCEITAIAHSGSNFVVIAVDSTRHQDDIPSVSYDWFDFGGLTRDVSLVTVPAAFIDDYEVQFEHEATFTLAGEHKVFGYVHVEGAPAGTAVKISIPEAGVSTTASTGADGRAQFSAAARSLVLWSPAKPHLYKVTISSGADSITDDIGFRDIRVSGLKVLLNGEPVFLRGVNLHAEAPVRGGRADSDADVALMFHYLQDLHANFVRLCHYPHDERMERTADRDGIMIWSEIPLWQHISFDKPAVYDKAVVMLHEMVRRDKNKASVILWSVSNETPNNPVRTSFLTNLANEARRTDPTRLITSALIGPHGSGNQMVQDDKLMDALDVVGQNEYIGWYGGKAIDADTTQWTLPQKPIIMSEFGGEAKQGLHGAKTERWREEQQLDIYQHQFVMFSHIPQLVGLTPWILFDFRSPGRNIPILQDGYNRKGLVSEDGKKKLAFDFMSDFYSKMPSSASGWSSSTASAK